MTRSALPLFDGFIETPFERRFQGLLRQGWRARRWHVIVAEPGSGKTMGICDLRDEASRQAGTIGGRRSPVLAVAAPKNDPREAALGNFLLTALGLCLVAAGRGAAIPLKDIFDQPETMWMQFRRRLDRVHPYCRIASHTEAEVRDILLALEQIYRPSFPALNFQQWTGSIYTWLTHPLLDPQKSGRVIMDHLMKLITTALEWSYAQGEKDVSPKHLEVAAEQLTLRRDVIYLIDSVERNEQDKGQIEESPKAPHPK
jgi:hypothetical protein